MPCLSDNTGTKSSIGILAKTGNDSWILCADFNYRALKCSYLAFQDISRYIQTFILHFRVGSHHHLIFLLQRFRQIYVEQLDAVFTRAIRIQFFQILFTT